MDDREQRDNPIVTMFEWWNRAMAPDGELSQEAFARRYGFTVSAVRDWEQGRRQPERSARILLTIIKRDPAVVRRALTAA